MFDQRSYDTGPATVLVDYAQVRRLAQEFRPLIVVTIAARDPPGA